MRLLARQMSGPVPSPSMNGTMGWLGTLRRPSLISMRWPSLGGVNCSSTDIGRPSRPHLQHCTAQTASSVAQSPWGRKHGAVNLTRLLRSRYSPIWITGQTSSPRSPVATQEHSLFQPVRRSRVSEDIIRQIQDLIAAEHLQPGDRLPGERVLAEAVSVSRQSVREALRVLDYLGVVMVRPGEGTFVATTPPSPVDPSLYSLLSERSFLLDLLEARRILEERIVHLAARRATREDLDAMDDALTARESGLAVGKHDVAGDLAFHTQLAELTGNPVLTSVMRHLSEMWRRARGETGRRPTSPHKALQFHRQILQAVRRRQPTAARRALRRHLDDMRADIEERGR